MLWTLAGMNSALDCAAGGHRDVAGARYRHVAQVVARHRRQAVGARGYVGPHEVVGKRGVGAQQRRSRVESTLAKCRRCRWRTPSGPPCRRPKHSPWKGVGSDTAGPRSCRHRHRAASDVVLAPRLSVATAFIA